LNKMDSSSGKFIELNHPLILHMLTLMRDKHTTPKDFRALLEEIASLMTYEATRDLVLKEVEIETPVCKAFCPVLKERSIAVIPVLRAGLGMVNGILNVIPQAKVGHIGLARDEKTLENTQYYIKFPEDIAEREVLVVDPMLATGGSMAASIMKIKEHGVKRIKVISLIGTKTGVERVLKEHPDVTIFIAKIDEELNEAGYIVPGLGDAGDRLFGTKQKEKACISSSPTFKFKHEDEKGEKQE